MRIPRSFLPLVMLAFALVLAAPATAKHPPGCSSGRTVAKNRYLRLFTVKGDPAQQEKRLFACDRKTHRVRQLDRAFDDGYVTSERFYSIRLARRYAAFFDESIDDSCKADCPPGYNPSSFSIGVYGGKANKRTFMRAHPENGSLALTVTGAVAWVESPASGVHAIQAHDADGTRTLDSGTGVDPHSLRVELTIVSWFRDGQERFARLR